MKLYYIGNKVRNVIAAGDYGCNACKWRCKYSVMMVVSLNQLNLRSELQLSLKKYFGWYFREFFISCVSGEKKQSQY